MELTPDVLDAILGILADRGVREFEGFGFHVRFTKPEVVFEKHDQKSDRAAPVPVKSQWEDPKLWPGGKPPAFPGKDQ